MCNEKISLELTESDLSEQCVSASARLTPCEVRLFRRSKGSKKPRVDRGAGPEGRACCCRVSAILVRSELRKRGNSVVSERKYCKHTLHKRTQSCN